VGVDTTKPAARLTSAIYGEGQHAGNLDIRWEAKDPWFAERARFRCFFSEQPNGPWSTIASGLPNTGQLLLACRIPDPREDLPPHRVLDEAGKPGWNTS